MYVDTGSRHLVEQVLSKYIKPGLEATFASTNSATVSVACINQWCSVNCWNLGESCTLAGEEPSGPATTVGQKRHFSELGESVIIEGGERNNSEISGPGPMSSPKVNKVTMFATRR